MNLSRLALLALGAALLAGGPARAAPSDGIMQGAIDRAVEPCDDFYHFACNGWLRANPIPADQSYWDVGGALIERNLTRLRDIMVRAAAGTDPATRKLGEYWTACMDEAAIERRGLDPLKPDLDRIESLTDQRDLAPLLARLHRLGVNALFGFTADQDAADAEQVIAEADQGGLGLPDRDYYLKTDPDSVKLRQEYRDHLERLAGLAGLPAAESRQAADTVLRFETSLAQVSMTEAQRIDPHATYHKLSVPALGRLAPDFAWAAYFKSVGAPAIASLNVAAPEFFKALDRLIRATPPDALRAYLRLRLVEHAAPELSRALVDESFAFFGRTLNGTKELRPRWKRCVAAADEDLGDALGRLYVAEVFPPSAKAAVTAMVGTIRAAFAEDLKSIPWMGAETRLRAEAKLAQMVDKIGYPDRWRDYTTLEIRPDDALGNRFRAAAFEMDRQLGKIGKPVDRSEWQMTPPTVNAYYDPQKNDINFPAGTLQPPYYDPAWDDAADYGSVGATIGHEMTHGFDNTGRMYDGAGNLRDWWTRSDAKQFETRARCLEDEYGGFTIAGGIHLKGDVTLGENTADNGGTRLAYQAFQQALARHKAPPTTDGFTPEQRFFIAYAQSWCTNQTKASARLQVQTDPHSIAEFRVNGVVRNMEDFRRAFACRTGSQMAPTKICRVW